MAVLASRQAELYAAESASLANVGQRWARLADAQSYLDRLVNSAWFFQRWPTFVRATIERRASGSVWSTCQHLDEAGAGGGATEGVILIATGSLTQPVVLHELAHLLRAPGLGHDPLFAETMLTLVRHEMGFFAFADYYHALRQTEAFRAIRKGVD